MIIETYTDKYYDDVVKLVGNFYDEAIHCYDIGLDKSSLAKTIINIKENNAGNAFLLIINGRCEGILAGIEVPALLNTKRIFQEIIWYVNPEFRLHGVTLMNKVETMLKIQGFDTMIMAVLEASKMDKLKVLYERMGFKPFEAHYIKEL